jgi:hypothetical protein
MSEPKLCPYRTFVELWEGFSGERKFGPCLQDKCAMWRTTRNFSHGETGFHEDKEATGYCGLAGKP